MPSGFAGHIFGNQLASAFPKDAETGVLSWREQSMSVALPLAQRPVAVRANEGLSRQRHGAIGAVCGITPDIIEHDFEGDPECDQCDGSGEYLLHWRTCDRPVSGRV